MTTQAGPRQRWLLGRWLTAGSVAGLMVAGLTACGDTRSTEAFCDTFKERAVQFHDKYTAADQQVTAGGNPFASLLMLMQSPADLQVMFQALDKVAPDDIEPSVNQMLEAMKQQQQAMNSLSLSSALGGLLIGLESSGAERDINDYLSQHCDLSYMHDN